MLDLSAVTDDIVIHRLDEALICSTSQLADRERILGATRTCADRFSFSNTRTYPRPDHPDPAKRRSLFFLLAAIIVSLRTTLENEQLAMSRLMARAESDAALLSLSVDELESLIRPAGMGRQKAERISASLHTLSSLPNGVDSLLEMPAPVARDFLLSLPGVGPKAADCLLTIGLGIPSMVVDVNVYRASSWILVGSSGGRNFNDPRDVRRIKDRLDSALAGEDAFLYQIVHTLLLLLGKSMSRSGHVVERCVGAEHCQYCSDQVALRLV
ncbi:MAG: hypothetical protein M0008_06350 [Actinomycetota bacterium]|nr:hypothetical protein [Actinomycetota bacterium]